jgi:hypothetical protein
MLQPRYYSSFIYFLAIKPLAFSVYIFRIRTALVVTLLPFIVKMQDMFRPYWQPSGV